MTSWHSYPKIYAVGHKAVRPVFETPVLIEEKVDGSQFSFGLIRGELRVKSKTVEFPIDAPNGMFTVAAETVKRLADRLHPEWTYRAEYLQSPRHNVLRYERAPEQNLIIFDIGIGTEDYLSYDEKLREADRLGLETVPCLFNGTVESVEHLVGLLGTTSVLGGVNIEGFVIKNYERYTEDKHPMFAKYVSEAFKEQMRGPDSPWMKTPKPELLGAIAANFSTKARWHKAVARMRDEGILEGSPRDIGTLVKYVQEDLQEECVDGMKAALWSHYGQDIMRKAVAGIAYWYKDELLASAFEDAAA